MESGKNTIDYSISDIHRARSIFIGLCESTISSFAKLNKFPTTPKFIIKLLNGNFIQINTLTDKWCMISFTDKKEFFENQNENQNENEIEELSVDNLDHLTDKILDFYNSANNKIAVTEFNTEELELELKEKINKFDSKSLYYQEQLCDNYNPFDTSNFGNCMHHIGTVK